MSKSKARYRAGNALRYVGDGRWIRGVPARDLEPDEAALFDADALVASGLYRTAEGRTAPVDDRSRALPVMEPEAASASAADETSADEKE
jgi:hypothetical protein